MLTNPILIAMELIMIVALAALLYAEHATNKLSKQKTGKGRRKYNTLG